ncbi:MAG: guanylate kinase [Ignavibacteria bacterium]|nr:guanylate kinase [Ignavibacteria bacterium]
MNTGKLIVVSAPSGCGKTTIAQSILKKHPSFLFSVSATTRPKRSAETEGKDYFFLSRGEFEGKIDQSELVEWEEIYGNYYGTLRSEVDRALAGGHVMLFDIDVKGALSIRKAYPEVSLLIFIEPPSFEILRDRLQGRKTEDETMLARRLDRVPMELEYGRQFNHRVVNDNLERAIEEVESIVQSYVNS